MKKTIITSIILLFAFSVYAQNKYPFQNTALSEDQRVENLISLMTLSEKISCLGTNPSVPRLGVQGTGHVEGLHGFSMGKIGGWGGDNPIPTTMFPQAYGMAQTWNVDMMKKMGQVEGYDIRYVYQNKKYKRGGLVLRAPNADISHDPRWGRNEECYGEDPFLVGSMAASFIQGLQGDDPKYWRVASLMKHFLANSNENERTWSTSNFDDRLLYEYYAFPFYKGVKDGGAMCYMAAYNKVNEVPMMVSPLLKDLTINQWGVDGIICTDGGALKLLISDHEYYKSIAMGAAQALKHGINQFLDEYKEGIEEALERGYIDEADIDHVLKGNFRIMLRLGMLDAEQDNKYTKIGMNNELEPWLTKENKEIVLEATRESIVLLKNKDDRLPVNDDVKNIVVVGYLADTVLCDWYGGDLPYLITPLDALRKELGASVNIKYYPDSCIEESLEDVKNADLLLAFGGNDPTGNRGWAKVERDSYGKESVDRKSIDLEDEQWIKELYEYNQNVVLILMSSFPYAINWSDHNLPAIVHMTHCSQEQGEALVDVLLGKYNPAGRLVQNWPMNTNALPDLLDYDIRNGSTYMYTKTKPLYPFGYGLSYTEFEYSNLSINQTQNTIELMCNIKNVGNYTGDEVTQVYVRYVDSAVDRPSKALKAFVRTCIEKGEQKRVKLVIDKDDLRYYDNISKEMKLEKCTINLLVGTSSDNIRMSEKLEIQ